MRAKTTSGKVISLFGFLFVLAALGCSGGTSDASSNDTLATARGDVRFRVETVAAGLEVPWAFVWLPKGSMLVTERPGRVRIIEKGQLRPEPVFTVPDVEPGGESGLMDISLHPDFAKNGFVYLAYAYGKSDHFVRVARYRYADGKFTDQKTIIEGIP